MLIKLFPGGPSLEKYKALLAGAEEEEEDQVDQEMEITWTTGLEDNEEVRLGTEGLSLLVDSFFFVFNKCQPVAFQFPCSYNLENSPDQITNLLILR